MRTSGPFLRTLECLPTRFCAQGFIECQSNYVEHPELVAQRIVRYGKLIDPSQLMAGVDCGFSVHVGMQGIGPGCGLR